MNPRVVGVIHLTPSSVDTWARCRRRYLLAQVLDIPASDPKGTASAVGLVAHEVLATIHETGTCQDAGHVQGVIARRGAGEPQVAAMVDRHIRRCPSGAEAIGHELERARLEGATGALFVATARIDAVWAHDGILDARDYKTGRPSFVDTVSDDIRARVQAFTLAPLAAERRLRLRIRYEELGPDAGEDPDPFEPDAEQLAAIADELAAVQAAMRAEREFRGVAESWACGTCEYRSICPDSTAPGEPTWP